MQSTQIEQVRSGTVDTGPVPDTAREEDGTHQPVTTGAAADRRWAVRALAVQASAADHAALFCGGTKLLLAGTDAAAWRSARLPRDVTAIVFRAGKAGARFEQLGTPQAGPSVEVAWPPNDCVAALALTDEGQAELADMLAWWKVRVPETVPPLLRWSRDGVAKPLEGWLADVLVDHLLQAKRALARRVVDLQTALSELREDHETTQTVLAVLRHGLAGHHVPPIECRLALHPGGGYVTPPQDGDGFTIRQRLPVSSQGLAAVALHAAVGRRRSGGKLRITLHACESGTTVISWIIPYAQLRNGWNLLELPSVLTGPRQTVDLVIRWEGGLDAAPQLSLSNQIVGKGGGVHLPKGEASRWALAMQLWTGLPGSRLVASEHAEGGELFESMVRGRQLFLSRSKLQEAELILPKNVNVNFEILRAAGDGSSIQLHPVGGHVSQARLPAVCPRGLARLEAVVRTECPQGPWVEYAMALAPAGAPLTLTRERAIEQTPNAILTTDWVRLAPNTLGTLMLAPEAPLGEPCDLHIATRMPPNTSDAYAWARWRNFLVQLA